MQSRVTALQVPITHASPGPKQRLNPKAIAQQPFPQSLSVVQNSKPASVLVDWQLSALWLQVALVPHEVHVEPALPWPHCVFVI
jgi:hypothetical protein